MVFQGQTTQHRFQVWRYFSDGGLLANRALCRVVTLLACFDHGTSLLLTPGACILMLGTSINDYNTSKHAAKFVMYMYSRSLI